MSWDSPISSALLTTDANFEAFHDGTSAIAIALEPYEVATFVFSIASEVGETDGLEWQILGGHRIIQDSAMGTVGSTTVIDVAVADNQSNDYYQRQEADG